MNLTYLQALLPVIIQAGSIVLILLIISFYRNYTLTAFLTALTFALSFVCLWFIPLSGTNSFISLLIKMDGYALFFNGLIIAAAFAITLLFYGYFREKKDSLELYVLLIIATIGACVLASAGHFLSLYLGLEILSVSLYVLIAYNRDSIRSIEAGIKYFVLASASSAFLLFGMALLYAETGSMGFDDVTRHFLSLSAVTALSCLAFSMMIVGIGFKLAIVPFHMWAPDVYQGAPAPVSAFIATVSKGAMSVVLLRFFFILDAANEEAFVFIFMILSVISMFAGNLLALRQRNIKRILAYSSIAHIGYLLVALIAGGSNYGKAVLFYMTAYFITVLSAFSVITVFSGREGDMEQIDAYKGLAWKRPFITAIFTASLLSLAGIPLTAGFIGKYYIVFTGVSSGHWLLVVLLVINSVISLYYYLRVVAVLYEKSDSSLSGAALPAVSIAGAVAISVLALLLVWAGVYPQTLLNVINKVI